MVNALIHADYQGQGGIVIEKYPDRFEFSNPGSLLLSLDQIFHGGVSECRNKSLQAMFTMIGAAERAGSGIDKIKIGWNSQHWRSPIVKEQMHPDRVIWVLPMLSLIPEKSLVHLKEKFGLELSKFNKLEVQALVTADVEGYVDNARMRQITGHHAADITKLLQNLASRGILQQNNRGRWTHYRLPSDSALRSSLPLDSHTVEEVDSVHKAGHSVHKEGDSVHKGGHSVHKKGGHSVHKEGDSVHKEGDSVHKDNHSVHKEEDLTDQWAFLDKIAERARLNKRLLPKEMESIILQLCSDHWLTRKQISDLLQRNPDSLRSRFLTSMVEHGLLQLRYPDKPNRSDQAYKTAEPKSSKRPRST